MAAGELGGHGATYLGLLWAVVCVLFGIATAGAVFVYRRAVRRVEMEEIDRVIDE